MLICSYLLVSTTMNDRNKIKFFRFVKFSLVLHLVLAASCRGFFQTLATSRHVPVQFSIGPSSSWMNSQCHQGLTLAALGASSGLSRHSRSSSTRLYESSSSDPLFASASAAPSSQQRKTKPPRFVQKAHSKKPDKKPSNRSMGDRTPRASSGDNTSTRRRRRLGPLPPGMPVTSWKEGRSIEELETLMLKRWGTLETTTATSSKSKSSTNPFQRPVIDPWANDDDSGDEWKTEPRNQVREFYDEDDEGFEILEDDDDDDDAGEWEEDALSSNSKNSRMKISHLISPKPVGGRGTNTDNAKRAPTESYFFNPNKQEPKPIESTLSSQRTNMNGVSKKTTPDAKNDDTPSSSSAKPQKNAAPQAATPLLDEDGNLVLLTVEEALNRFQAAASTDEDAVAASMSTEEAPMVAYQIQQQQSQEYDDNFEPLSSWSNLGITSEVLLENLNAMSCAAPLSVQEKAIPAILTGNDVLIGTYTGSGKTLAFLVPLVERLLWSCGSDSDNEYEDPGLAVLIVAPGRELASQITSVARQLLEDTPLSVQLAIGGTTFSRNVEQIRKRKPNILVGTPGRIAELVVGKPGEKSGKLKIGDLQTLVLDEFDALLEYKPHRDPTKAILQTLQRRHGDALQSIMCSATASDLMNSPKVTEYLRPGFATAMADENDIFVTNNDQTSTTLKPRPQVSRTVMHGVIHVPHRRFALDTIRRILHTEPIPQQILIFVESARKVDVVVEKLAERGIIAAPLHGGQGSDKMDRAEVSKALREGYVGIVVATELAARGLDAPLLTHVINLDLPTDSSHYAHRAGRCGRGGRPGVVINMTTSPQERNVPQRFAQTLGIEMYAVEPRQGKLVLVDPETLNLDM